MGSHASGKADKMKKDNSGCLALTVSVVTTSPALRMVRTVAANWPARGSINDSGAC